MKKQSYDIDPAAVAPQAPPTEEELAAAKETVKQERKQSRLAKASFAWTVISMLYAIVSGAVLISGKWILAPYSYIMAGLLGVYVVIFAVLVVSFAGDAKAGKKKIKTFKKLFGMFKIFTNIVFLIATAISMVGVVDGRGTGLLEWIVLGANMLVAAIQLTLKIWLFVLGIIAKRIGKKYTVKVQTYVNGVVKEHKTKSAVMSKLYGTEVTKEAAGVVILDDNFATIVAAVREGRILYQNIRAFIRYLLACNLGEVLTVVLGMAVGTPPIFLPVQLLLINLITDGLPAVALGLEPAGRQVDPTPPRPKDQPLLTGGMLAGIAVRGFSLAFCNIMSFLAAYGLSGSLVTARTAAYFTLVFSQMLYIVGTRRSGLFSNPALSGAVLFSLAVTLITIYWPLLHVIFETTSLSGLPLAAAAGATLLSLPLGALLDRILHKR